MSFPCLISVEIRLNNHKHGIFGGQKFVIRQCQVFLTQWSTCTSATRGLNSPNLHLPNLRPSCHCFIKLLYAKSLTTQTLYYFIIFLFFTEPFQSSEGQKNPELPALQHRGLCQICSSVGTGKFLNMLLQFLRLGETTIGKATH